MNEGAYLAVFMLGLLGGVHCASMCGGIVSALSLQPNLPSQRKKSSWGFQLVYNAGRILSYTAAGALVGLVGSFGLLMEGLLPIQLLLYVAANLMLVALGLYLTGMTRSLAWMERIGQRLWRHVQPLAQRFMPARTLKQGFALGLLWGWLPCGMVYSVLATALLSGSAARGAGLLLAFGLGTLPNLLFAGVMLKQLRHLTRAAWLRLGSGLMVLGFGAWGLAHAGELGGHLWSGILC